MVLEYMGWRVPAGPEPDGTDLFSVLVEIIAEQCLMRFIMISVACVVAAVPSAHAASTFNPERFGIGAEVVQADTVSAIWVNSCLKGGPADRAGLKHGDVFVELDGWDVTRWSFQEVIRYLTRDKPLPVQVTFRRDDEVLSVQLVREKFSDMGKSAGIRYRMSPDSTRYDTIPFDELAPAAIGDTIRFAGLRNAQCQDATWTADPTRPTFIYFWATWCAPCKTLIEKLNDPEFNAKGGRLIGVNLDNDCEAFRKAATALRVPGKQFWAGWYGDLPQVLRVHRRGVPTGAVLDQNGRLLGSALGVDSVLALFRESAR